tara:strand:- start:249 stop:509 length:261 start_codon:yes stop_codon:yes gene_type:complete
MRFNYKFEETSTDTRHFYIESEVELTEDEARLLISEVSLTDNDSSSGDINDWDIQQKGSYKVTFKGTEYGDNTDIEITGDDVKEED